MACPLRLSHATTHVHSLSEEHSRLREVYGIAWMLLEQVHGDKYHDPMLTPRGREQAHALRLELRHAPGFDGFDLVAVSPMRRTIATALLAIPQLEAASTAFPIFDTSLQTPQPSAHAAEARSGPPPVPPVVATELLRELIGPFSCDSRRTRSQLEREYARLGGGVTIDFGDVPEADEMFAHGVERDLVKGIDGVPALRRRAVRALRWLLSLPDDVRRVAVVSHGHFLEAACSLFPSGVSQAHFSNAMARTIFVCETEEEGRGEVEEGAGAEGVSGGGEALAAVSSAAANAQDVAVGEVAMAARAAEAAEAAVAAEELDAAEAAAEAVAAEAAEAAGDGARDERSSSAGHSRVELSAQGRANPVDRLNA